MATTDLRNTITVETKGIEDFLKFTQQVKKELAEIKKILQDKGFKGNEAQLTKAAAAYRREMLKAINDIGKANEKVLLRAMNAKKTSLSAGGGVENAAQIKELEVAIEVIKELTKTTKDSKKAVDSLGKSIADLNKEQQKTTKVKKEVVQLTQAELVQLEAEKIKKRENTLIAKQNAIIQNQEKDSIASLRAQLSLTTLEWSKLTQEEIENTANGRLLNAEKTRLTEQLKKVEKATGDHRREVGNYTLAGNKAASMVSRLGLAGNKLTGIFGRVGRALDTVGFGGFALAAAAATIAWQFFADNVLGGSEDIIEKNKELKASITDLTASLEQGFREGKLLEIDNSSLSEAEKRLAKINFLSEETGRLQSELGAANRAASEAQSVVDVGIFQTELAKNEAIEKALKLDNERNKLAKELSNTKKQINDIESEGDKAAQDAAEKRKEDSEKRLENEKKLALDLEKITADRVKDEREFENEIIRLRIESIKDVTEKAIAAENERNRLQQEQSADNFIELRKQRLEELEKIKEYLGVKSEEYLKFEVETYNEIDKLKKLNDTLSEAQEKEHQQNLKQIKADAASETRKAAFKAAADAISDQKKYNDERERVLKEAEDELLQETKAYNAAQAEEQQKAEDLKTQIRDASESAFNSTANLVKNILKSSADAENEILSNAISARQKSIDDLNEKLKTAVGAQRVYLEERVKQEKIALEKQNQQAEQARREQAEVQRGIALGQAIVNIALGVTSALKNYPEGIPAAIAVGVAGAAEITAIALQKFALGGVIEGNSHAQGGVRASVKGAPDVELEGGEIVINKNSARMFRKELEYYNVMGGGRKFQFGGDVSPNFQAIASSNNGDQRRIVKEIAAAPVFVSVTEITNMQNRVVQVAQKSSF